jgi:hypothetical protein
MEHILQEFKKFVLQPYVGINLAEVTVSYSGEHIFRKHEDRGACRHKRPHKSSSTHRGGFEVNETLQR